MKLKISVLLYFLFVTSAYAGGGYGCRAPADKFSGDYEIFVLTEKNHSEINELVKGALAKVEKKRPDLFRDAQIEVSALEVEEFTASTKDLSERVTKDTDRTFIIGIGNVGLLRRTFDENGVKNGVILPSKDSAVALDSPEREKSLKLGTEEYYDKMTKHAVYRGLLQLNGEEKPQVTEITVEHILSVDLE